jgi:hypothetical protein
LINQAKQEIKDKLLGIYCGIAEIMFVSSHNMFKLTRKFCIENMLPTVLNLFE